MSLDFTFKQIIHIPIPWSSMRQNALHPVISNLTLRSFHAFNTIFKTLRSTDSYSLGIIRDMCAAKWFKTYTKKTKNWIKTWILFLPNCVTNSEAFLFQQLKWTLCKLTFYCHKCEPIFELEFKMAFMTNMLK